MRLELVKQLCEAAHREKFVFLTGDLGFKTLEPLKEKMGDRFLNAGISEQNMISTASGLAISGMKPWCYSIAPFLYARAFEFIRNDVCIPNLQVVMVGNGAGYGYGVMGPSHHALNDYGVLATLPNIICMVPAFDSDIAGIVTLLLYSRTGPIYLRLGVSEENDVVDPIQASWGWRQLFAGTSSSPIVVVMGSIVGTYLQDLKNLCSLWVVNVMPFEIPDEFLLELSMNRKLIIIEEHVAEGGFGQALIYKLSFIGLEQQKYEHRYAKGYPSGLYGSKEFHRKESGLDVASIVSLVKRSK